MRNRNSSVSLIDSLLLNRPRSRVASFLGHEIPAWHVRWDWMSILQEMKCWPRELDVVALVRTHLTIVTSSRVHVLK